MSEAVPPMPAGRLVHQDPGVRQRVSLARGARREQELAHRGRQTHRVGGDVAVDELHRVEDRHAGGDRAAGAVDVEVDVALGVLRRQQQQLRADLVGDRVVDWLAEEDDALAQQPVVDGVVAGSCRSPTRACRRLRIGIGSNLPVLMSLPSCDQGDPSKLG